MLNQVIQPRVEQWSEGGAILCGHGGEKLNGALHDRQPWTDGIRGVWVDTGDIIFSSKVRSQRDCPKLLEIAYFTREGMR